MEADVRLSVDVVLKSKLPVLIQRANVLPKPQRQAERSMPDLSKVSTGMSRMRHRTLALSTVEIILSRCSGM